MAPASHYQGGRIWVTSWKYKIRKSYSRFWYSCFQHALPQKWMISSVKLYKTFHIIYNFYLWFWFYIYFPYFTIFLRPGLFLAPTGALEKVVLMLVQIMRITTANLRRFSFRSFFLFLPLSFRHMHKYKNKKTWNS